MQQDVDDDTSAKPIQNPKKKEECVLMFSGGRDSTLAAVDLYRLQNLRPLLVTVTSAHLFGYAAVENRLKELKALLPPETRHVQVLQPTDLRTSQEFYFETCLPCQHAYVVVAATVAKLNGIKRIALGYTQYQGDWPEQTIIATEALRRVLNEFNIELLLPAYEFGSKDEVQARLTSLNLSSKALEQKCSKQVNNIALSPTHLAEQINGWEGAIRKSLTDLDEIKLEIMSTRYLGSY